MKRRRAVLAMVVAFSLLTFSWAGAEVAGLSYYRVGGQLANTGDYAWWYGCSPTSAGMMMGYYDRNGYGGLFYSNLVPGGVAEASTFPSTAGTWQYLAQYTIASPGHVADFYVSGYLGSGDDVSPPFHSFNSLADFMGTSQDSVGNSNGSTTFYYWTNGAPFTAEDAVTSGVQDFDRDVRHGRVFSLRRLRQRPKLKMIRLSLLSVSTPPTLPWDLLLHNIRRKSTPARRS